MLKQKYMETKTKRNVKKNDKKPMDNGNTMPVSKYNENNFFNCTFWLSFIFLFPRNLYVIQLYNPSGSLSGTRFFQRLLSVAVLFKLRSYSISNNLFFPTNFR